MESERTGKVEYSPMCVVGDTGIIWGDAPTVVHLPSVFSAALPNTHAVKSLTMLPDTPFTRPLLYEVKKKQTYTDVYAFALHDDPFLYHLVRWPNHHTTGWWGSNNNVEVPPLSTTLLSFQPSDTTITVGRCQLLYHVGSGLLVGRATHVTQPCFTSKLNNKEEWLVVTAAVRADDLETLQIYVVTVRSETPEVKLQQTFNTTLRLEAAREHTTEELVHSMVVHQQEWLVIHFPTVHRPVFTPYLGFILTIHIPSLMENIPNYWTWMSRQFAPYWGTGRSIGALGSLASWQTKILLSNTVSLDAPNSHIGIELYSSVLDCSPRISFGGGHVVYNQLVYHKHQTPNIGYGSHIKVRSAEILQFLLQWWQHNFPTPRIQEHPVYRDRQQSCTLSSNDSDTVNSAEFTFMYWKKQEPTVFTLIDDVIPLAMCDQHVVWLIETLQLDDSQLKRGFSVRVQTGIGNAEDYQRVCDGTPPVVVPMGANATTGELISRAVQTSYQQYEHLHVQVVDANLECAPLPQLPIYHQMIHWAHIKGCSEPYAGVDGSACVNHFGKQWEEPNSDLVRSHVRRLSPMYLQPPYQYTRPWVLVVLQAEFMITGVAFEYQSFTYAFWENIVWPGTYLLTAVLGHNSPFDKTLYSHPMRDNDVKLYNESMYTTYQLHIDVPTPVDRGSPINQTEHRNFTFPPVSATTVTFVHRAVHNLWMGWSTLRFYGWQPHLNPQLQTLKANSVISTKENERVNSSVYVSFGDGTTGSLGSTTLQVQFNHEVWLSAISLKVDCYGLSVHITCHMTPDNATYVMHLQPSWLFYSLEKPCRTSSISLAFRLNTDTDTYTIDRYWDDLDYGNYGIPRGFPDVLDNAAEIGFPYTGQDYTPGRFWSHWSSSTFTITNVNFWGIPFDDEHNSTATDECKITVNVTDNCHNHIQCIIDTKRVQSAPSEISLPSDIVFPSPSASAISKTSFRILSMKYWIILMACISVVALLIISVAVIVWGSDKHQNFRKRTKRTVHLASEHHTMELQISQHAIGMGGQANVFSAMDVETGVLYAVKIFHTTPNLLDTMKREHEALASIDHPNVVQTFGLLTTEEDGGESVNCMLVLEYLGGGCLATVLQHSKLTAHVTKQYCIQILGGLAAIHDAGLIHADVKSENILLDGFGNCKIVDFGTVRHDDTVLMTDHSNRGGTVLFTPPEYMRGAPPSVFGDIWMFGLTVIEMVSGIPPWPTGLMEAPPPTDVSMGVDHSTVWVLENLAKMGQYYPLLDESFRTAESLIHAQSQVKQFFSQLSAIPHLSDFLRSCLCNNASKRLCATDLLQHPFLSNPLNVPFEVVGQQRSSTSPAFCFEDATWSWSHE